VETTNGNDIDCSFRVLTFYANGLYVSCSYLGWGFLFLYKFGYGALGMFGVMAGGAGS